MAAADAEAAPLSPPSPANREVAEAECFKNLYKCLIRKEILDTSHKFLIFLSSDSHLLTQLEVIREISALDWWWPDYQKNIPFVFITE